MRISGESRAGYSNEVLVDATLEECWQSLERQYKVVRSHLDARVEPFIKVRITNTDDTTTIETRI